MLKLISMYIKYKKIFAHKCRSNSNFVLFEREKRCKVHQYLAMLNKVKIFRASPTYP